MWQRILLQGDSTLAVYSLSVCWWSPGLSLWRSAACRSNRPHRPTAKHAGWARWETALLACWWYIGPVTWDWKQSLMLDLSCCRKMLMLFHSRRLAQINLTSMSLIKFPHWSLAPLPSSAYDLIPSVLGDGWWRAAGMIFHRGETLSLSSSITPPFSLFFLIDNRGSFWPTFASAPWPK